MINILFCIKKQYSGKVARILRLPDNLEILYLAALGKPFEEVVIGTVEKWRYQILAR